MATITTLIPAYKKDYLAELFLGLARQSCRDFRVVIGDDSPDDGIAALIQAGQWSDLTRGMDITVLRGPKNMRLNQRALLDHWADSSPYVHMHLDDDVIFPDFYRQHLQAHAGGEFCASVSRRWLSHENTRPVYGFDQPACVTDSALRFVPLDGKTLVASMVPVCNNWMGEFSNILLSAAGARLWPRAAAQGMNYFGWPDVGYLLEASQTLPVVVLRDHLSVFRQHPAQTTHHMQHHGGRVSSLAWAANALHAWKTGQISHVQAVQAITHTVGICLKRYGEDDEVMDRFFDIVQQHGRQMDALYQHFEQFWRRLLASHASTAPAGVFPDVRLTPYAPALAEGGAQDIVFV
jgi:hypothetical protein